MLFALGCAIRQKCLNFDPGERYQYSNSNLLLLAEVVHRACCVLISMPGLGADLLRELSGNRDTQFRSIATDDCHFLDGHFFDRHILRIFAE